MITVCSGLWYLLLDFIRLVLIQCAYFTCIQDIGLTEVAENIFNYHQGDLYFVIGDAVLKRILCLHCSIECIDN